MNRRYREILNIILNTDGCITGTELAKHCSVSVRTIRGDMKGINELLKGYGIQIDAIFKKGYCLEEGNKQLLKENNIIKKVLDQAYIMETPASPLDRQMYILSKLTCKDRLHTDELADALYVSQSTIDKDVAWVKKWLRTNLNTGMEYSLNDGISLRTDENGKRNIISWILGARLNASTISKYWHYLFGEKEINPSTAALYHIVKAQTNENGYCLSGHSSQCFCLEILVAAERYQAGHQVSPAKGLSISPVLAGIWAETEKLLAVHLPDEEWHQLQ